MCGGCHAAPVHGVLQLFLLQLVAAVQLAEQGCRGPLVLRDTTRDSRVKHVQQGRVPSVWLVLTWQASYPGTRTSVEHELCGSCVVDAAYKDFHYMTLLRRRHCEEFG